MIIESPAQREAGFCLFMKEGLKKGRTPSAVEAEWMTSDELNNVYSGNENSLLTILFKSLKPHDSRRNMRRRAKDEKAKIKKLRQGEE